MAVFEYVAFDTSGRQQQGVVDAGSPQAARRKLRDLNLMPTEVLETREALASPKKEVRLGRLFKGSLRAELVLTTRQLSVLLEAGMPLVDSLTAILDQVDDPRLLKVIFDVRDRISEGSTFANALAAHPKVFTPLYANMVKAGETSGALQPILARLADFMEKQARLQKRITSSLAYPIVMALMGVGVVVFLMTVVIPRVAQIFEDLDRTLPTVTVVLIGLCGFVKGYWWLILLAIVAFVAGFRAYIRTPNGGLRWDGLKLRMPIIGDLVKKICVSRFARTLGTLGESGLPMMLSLDIVKNVVSNKVLEKAIEEAQVRIRKGSDIATPLRKNKVFPPIVIHMIALGERSGQLDKMLTKVADNYDEEVETSITGLVSLLEPIMIVSMGVVVGFLVFAILMPIFELSQSSF